MTAPLNAPRTPPYKIVGVVLLLVVALVVTLVWMQFRGAFTPRTQLTLLADRAGLVMDPGSKVTFNGVEIGRVAQIHADTSDDRTRANIVLDVDPKYVDLIPSNADVEIKASTVFGNKYVAFASPPDPSPTPITSAATIDVTKVTTEFNTLFQTVVDIARQVDPIKLNQTLTATAQALDGLGDRFGESIIDGNAILDDLNPQMPQIRYDVQRLADLNAVYAAAAPDLFDGLENAVTTAQTLYQERGNLDQTLLASIGFGNTAGEVFERGGPYLVRGSEDLVTVTEILDYHSPALFCMIR